MSPDLIFLINSFASFFMTGLIWYVQLVHYPSFRFVREADFHDFHNFHSLRTGYIVMPVMVTELASSGALWYSDSWSSLNAWGFYIVILIWAATFFLSVPMHSILNSAKDDDAINRLVTTNWLRTILWTIKSVLAIILLYG